MQGRDEGGHVVWAVHVSGSGALLRLECAEHELLHCRCADGLSRESVPAAEKNKAFLEIVDVGTYDPVVYSFKEVSKAACQTPTLWGSL